jgi:hypothetical protein
MTNLLQRCHPVQVCLDIHRALLQPSQGDLSDFVEFPLVDSVNHGF